MLARILGLEETSEIFTEAEKKALKNTILIPFILGFVFQNVLMGIGWVLLMTVIYIFIHKNKKENARAFFNFLKVITFICLVVVVIGLSLIIG